MIPSRSLEDDKSLRKLYRFVKEPVNDRRELALSALTKIFPIQQVLMDKSRLELSAATRKDLDSMLSELLTCIDVVLSNR